MKVKFINFVYYLFLYFMAVVNIINAQITLQSYNDFEVSQIIGTYTKLTIPTVLDESDGYDFSLTNDGSGFIEPGTEHGKSVTDWAKIGFVAVNGNSNSPKDYSYSDDIRELSMSKCKYKLEQIDYDGKYDYSEVVEKNIDLPTKFELEKNYPNPFNPTTIKYSIPSAGEGLVLPSKVILKVYDILGREVATLVNEKQSPGNYEVKFDASEIANGVYIYKLQSGNYSAIRKLIYIK